MFYALYVPMLLFEPARGCWYLSFGRAANTQTSVICSHNESMETAEGSDQQLELCLFNSLPPSVVC